MVIQPKLYTVEEFEVLLRLPENRDRLLELIHGRIVEKMPTDLHGIVASLFAHYLWDFVLTNELEGLVGVEVRHNLTPDKFNSRLPDVSFRYGTNEDIVKQGAVLQMPDLAVEVQSPDDTPESLREKAEYYLRNGSRLVFIIYTEHPSAEACTLEKGKLVIRPIDIEGMLDGGDVLSGFHLPLSKLFRTK
jgi:Uma2 family endonuclease